MHVTPVGAAAVIAPERAKQLRPRRLRALRRDVVPGRAHYRPFSAHHNRQLVSITHEPSTDALPAVNVFTGRHVPHAGQNETRYRSTRSA